MPRRENNTISENGHYGYFAMCIPHSGSIWPAFSQNKSAYEIIMLSVCACACPQCRHWTYLSVIILPLEDNTTSYIEYPEFNNNNMADKRICDV